MATLNVVVNPLGIYPTHNLRPIAWSSREVKTELMRKAEPPVVLLLGSSRSMSVTPRRLSALLGGPAFNASVDSALAEDYLALWSYARHLGWSPRHLVVGVDLEAFHASAPVDNRLLAARDLRPFLEPSMRVSAVIEPLRALLSWQQTRESVRSIGFALRGYPEEAVRFDADGLARFPIWERQIAAGTFQPDLAASRGEYDARFAGFDTISEERWSRFAALVSSAASQGTTVRAFVTPLSRSLREHLATRHPFAALRTTLAERLETLAAKEPRFRVRDFTTAADGEPEAAVFLDGAHLREEAIDRIVERLLRETDALQ